MRIIFATGNQDKVRECRQILKDAPVEIVSMREAGIEADIEENGETFEENAMIKAQAIHKIVPDDIILADDSGLCIDYLDGEPGIYSARYLGEDTPYEIKNAKLLERLDGVPKEKRTARFVCAVAAVLPDGSHLSCRGTIEGYIGDHAEGENGFGYDPIFFIDPQGHSTATLTAEEKNEISHRGKAMRAINEELAALPEEVWR